jgi:hypothetical protein
VLKAGGNPQKLEIVEGMRNGFDFYFYLDRIYKIDMIFRLRRVGFGRRPHYPVDPVDPVQFF